MSSAIAILLAGCTTTQHEAQRERLDSARQRAALESTRVTRAGGVLVPTRVATVRAGGRTAFVVTVRNDGRRAASDLPISVGYTAASGARVYLNAGTDLNYFQAHLPAIRAAHSLTWVYATDRTLPPGARPFALVGSKPSVPALLTEMSVRIGLSYTRVADGQALTVDLSNATSVPQYQLQVYAYAVRGGRLLAAGNATVGELGAGSRRRLRLALVGRLNGEVHVEAVPTILQ